MGVHRQYVAPRAPVGQAGVSLVETIAVLAIIGITVGSAAIYLAPTSAPVVSGAIQLEQYFGLARARAISTTSAFRVAPTASTHVAAEYADSCSATTWTADSQVELELPQGVTMTSTAWTVCFSSRGAADPSIVVTLNHAGFTDQQVEVVLGGSARVIP